MKLFNIFKEHAAPIGILLTVITMFFYIGRWAEHQDSIRDLDKIKYEMQRIKDSLNQIPRCP